MKKMDQDLGPMREGPAMPEQEGMPGHVHERSAEHATSHATAALEVLLSVHLVGIILSRPTLVPLLSIYGCTCRLWTEAVRALVPRLRLMYHKSLPMVLNPKIMTGTDRSWYCKFNTEMTTADGAFEWLLTFEVGTPERNPGGLFTVKIDPLWRSPPPDRWSRRVEIELNLLTASGKEASMRFKVSFGAQRPSKTVKDIHGNELSDMLLNTGWDGLSNALRDSEPIELRIGIRVLGRKHEHEDELCPTDAAGEWPETGHPARGLPLPLQ